MTDPIMGYRSVFRTVIVSMLFASLNANAQQARIVLDGLAKGRNFDGIGAVSAGASSRLLIDYPEPQRSQILDYLFRPNYGASLQRLKVEVGADVNSTDGAEPSHMRSASDHNSSRGYEWWLMVEAHKRNPEILLEILPWGAPAWVGKNATLYTPQMADYMVEFIQMAKRHYGLAIANVGVWNEKEFDVAYIKELRRKLDAAHLATRIVCCDNDWKIADAILNDPELAAVVAAIGAHYPRTDDLKLTTTAAALKTGKPLWSSEDQPNGVATIVSRDWAEGGRVLARSYNKNYLEGSLTATEIWSPVTAYYDNLAAPNSGLMYANTPWSGHYAVQSAIWVTAHTTQFAQPGWRYLDASSGTLPGKGSYVSLRSPSSKDWSVVLETIDAKSPQEVIFSVTGGLNAASKIHVWETNRSHTFDHVADLEPRDGAFHYTFDPDSLYSLTTTTGQRKGTAAPPAPADFPFPYSDNFETTMLGRAPKFLADQDGAFEAIRCVGRKGRCLEQVIVEKPIAWGAVPAPYTLAGNPAWADYNVAVDARFLSDAPAVLMGRIDSADNFQDDKALGPSGYALRVNPNGHWELLSTTLNKPVKQIIGGAVNLNQTKWHRLELRFRGKNIKALLDGELLVSTADDAHAHGMIAVGTEWNRIQFDNLAVTKPKD